MRRFVLLVTALLCAACVGKTDLEERLQPLEQQTIVLHNEQQELQLRVAATEQRTESLQDQLSALPRNEAVPGKRGAARSVPRPAGSEKPKPSPAAEAKTEAPAVPAPQPTPAPAAAPADATLAAAASETPPAERPAPPAETPRRITGERPSYQHALKMYERGRHAEAEALFDAFVRDFPASTLVPNALYWKGECRYSRGGYADAVFIFKDVTARFPKHPKAADALFKTALAYHKLGDAENAELHFRILSEDYPSSPLVRRGKALGL